MLKPRYGTFTESVSDFKRMMDGMNKVQPLEPARPKTAKQRLDESKRLDEAAPAVYQSDADLRMMMDSVFHYMPNEVKTTLNVMFEEEQRLADIYDKLDSGRIHFTEADKSAMARRHVEATNKYNGMANRLSRMSKTAHSASEREQYVRMCEAAQRKAKQHEHKGQRYNSQPLVNNLDPAPMSRYQTESNALQSFRILAGLDESVMMPRDPGVSGTTKFNAQFSEGRSKEQQAAGQHAMARRVNPTIGQSDAQSKSIKKYSRALNKPTAAEGPADKLAAKVGSKPYSKKRLIKQSTAQMRNSPKVNLPGAEEEIPAGRIKRALASTDKIPLRGKPKGTVKPGDARFKAAMADIRSKLKKRR